MTSTGRHSAVRPRAAAPSRSGGTGRHDTGRHDTAPVRSRVPGRGAPGGAAPGWGGEPVPRRSARPPVEPVLLAEDLVRVHGRGRGAVRALDGVSVEVERGELVGVMGASGSGKSTLLHCLAGLDRPTRGRVHWAGVDVTGLSERRLTRLRRERIGVVFQAYDLLPQLTVRQNVVLPVEIAGARPDREWLDTVLEVLGLESVARKLPRELSGGQQQRVAVARALALRPDVVLADEPTGALDVGTAADLMRFLRGCIDGLGTTVVMATHDPLAAEWADRVLLLHSGRVAVELEAPSAHACLDALARARPPARGRGA